MAIKPEIFDRLVKKIINEAFEEENSINDEALDAPSVKGESPLEHSSTTSQDTEMELKKKKKAMMNRRMERIKSRRKVTKFKCGCIVASHSYYNGWNWKESKICFSPCADCPGCHYRKNKVEKHETHDTDAHGRWPMPPIR